MKGPQYQYTKELYERFGYLAAWTPATPVALGDVGEMDGNVFRRVSSLKQLGVSFHVTRGAAQEDLIYTSEAGINLSFKAAGSPIVEGSSLLVQKAGATIEFSKGAGVVFVAKDCTATLIADQITLGRELARLYNLGSWDAKYAVVTELKQAASMSAFISESSGGKIELIAENSLNLGAVSLADLDAKFAVGVSNGINTQIIAQDKLTPLFRTRKLKVSWLGGVSFDNKRSLHDLEKIPRNIEIEEDSAELADFIPKFD
ncbi:MAG TPA: hypothetical protein PKY59_18570 [Pyrinomonadaceae bacterium]|nr:hypothetical protein [Pyrinomonadaceae bacterium]